MAWSQFFTSAKIGNGGAESWEGERRVNYWLLVLAELFDFKLNLSFLFYLGKCRGIYSKQVNLLLLQLRSIRFENREVELGFGLQIRAWLPWTIKLLKSTYFLLLYGANKFGSVSAL